MGLSSAVQWWEEWQLRILVLGSLGVQCYLALFASYRKKYIRPLFRSLIWLAYLGGDALAIYALATLFNRQKKVQHSSVNGSHDHDLEVLWAPILLRHLGGPINISAYNIEDNELWSRHALTAVAQVTVALYVFSTSWSPSADKRLLVAAVLLFVIGFFKCIDKPIALKRASFSSIVTTFRPAPRSESANREVELEEYIQKAREFSQLDQSRSASRGQLSTADKLFVDYAYVYRDRLIHLRAFWSWKKESVYNALCLALSHTFNLIYTKTGHGHDEGRATPECINFCSNCLALSNLLFPIMPIGFFHGSHKEGYRRSDIIVTFLLLYITYILEILSFLTVMLFLVDWSDGVAQHNLIGFFTWNRRHARLVGIAKFLQFDGLLHTYFGCKPCHLAKDITMLVREHVMAGWTSHITGIDSYWRFSDTRGQWALERSGGEEILGCSIQKPLDESIILWNVATDLCFYSRGTSGDSQCARMCRQISNYMMHLLFANPEMLLPGSRRNLFTVAYDELEDILQGDDLSQVDERGVTVRIIKKAKEAKLPEGFIQDSWILAQELMRFVDDDKMWKLIKDVWVEMLCFSASRCRGYLHAKSLGSGGEFLSYISLLMSHGGLETYAERQQRVQLRLPKEARLHIVRIKIMKKEIEEAARNMERRIMERTTGASAEVQIVIS